MLTMMKTFQLLDALKKSRLKSIKVMTSMLMLQRRLTIWTKKTCRCQRKKKLAFRMNYFSVFKVLVLSMRSEKRRSGLRMNTAKRVLKN